MSIKRRKFSLGIRLKPTAEVTTLAGELRAASEDLKFKGFIDGSERSIVTEDQAQTLTNKTIDVDNNTVSNIEVDNLKAGVLNTDLSGAATDTELPSALAVKTALDLQNEAAEIVYDPSDSSLTATNVKAALDEGAGRLDATESATTTNATNLNDHIVDAVDAHDASAISNVPAGNLDATDQQSVNNELQSDIDTRALDSALTDHVNDAADAHAASSITNTPSGNLAATDLQGAVDELQTDVDSRALDSALTAHTGASAGVHGIVGDVVGTTDAQTLTSKIIQGASIESPSRLDPKNDTQVNLEVYAATAQNGELVYATDTKLSYRVIDGELVELGAGSASGGINYISDPGFERGITDWTGDVSLVLSEETVAPLRGDKSLRIGKLAADASTQIVHSETFTIADADLAKIMIVSFDQNFSDTFYNDGDARVIITQDPAGTPKTIRVNGEDIAGGKNKHYARFQTDAVVKTYRVDIEWVDTGVNPVLAYIDNVSVGPQVIQQGAIITDSIKYTPILNSNTNVSENEASYTRVGDIAHLQGRIRYSGVGAAVQLEVSIPTDLKIDLSKLSVNPTSVATNIGSGTWVDVGTRWNVLSVVYNKDEDKFSFVQEDGTNLLLASLFQNQDEVSYTVSIPIQGWSSQANMSSDFGGRDISAKYSGNNGDSITADVTLVPFTLKSKDLSASWSGTKFVSPEKGTYIFSGATRATTATTRFLKPLLNGVFIGEFYGAATPIQTSPFYLEIDLEFNDEVEFNFGTSLTLLNDPSHVLNIRKASSPQTNLEVETIAARYTSDSGQGISSTAQPLICEDRDYDTHGFYNPLTGLAKIPETGFYKVVSNILTNAVPMNIGESTQLQARVNGTSVSSGVRMNTVSSATSTNRECLFEDVLFLFKDDELAILKFNTQGSSLSVSPVYNYITITKVK